MNLKKIGDKTSSFAATLIIVFIVVFILAVLLFLFCFILIIVGTEYQSYWSLIIFLMIFSAVSVPFDFLYSFVWNKLLRKPDLILLDKISLFIGLISVSIAAIVITDYFLESISISALGVISLAAILTVIEMYLQLSQLKEETS